MGETSDAKQPLAERIKERLRELCRRRGGSLRVDAPQPQPFQSAFARGTALSTDTTRSDAGALRPSNVRAVGRHGHTWRGTHRSSGCFSRIAHAQVEQDLMQQALLRSVEVSASLLFDHRQDVDRLAREREIDRTGLSTVAEVQQRRVVERQDEDVEAHRLHVVAVGDVRGGVVEITSVVFDHDRSPRAQYELDGESCAVDPAGASASAGDSFEACAD